MQLQYLTIVILIRISLLKYSFISTENIKYMNDYQHNSFVNVTTKYIQIL